MTPGVKSDSTELTATLPLETHAPFCSLCTRANYLAEDTPGVRLLAKEIGRLMVNIVRLAGRNSSDSDANFVDAPTGTTFGTTGTTVLQFESRT